MTRRASRLANAAVRLYALILRLYPADFRRACADPMLRTFEELLAARAERQGRVRFLYDTLAEYVNALAGAREMRRTPIDRRTAVRVAHGAGWLASSPQEVAHAVRRLVAQPALVGFTILTLGFAIAANAALFSIVDAVLLRPSPFTAVDRLVNVENYSTRGRFTYPGLSRVKLQHWRAERDIFDAVEAYRPMAAIVTGGLEPQEVAAAQLSPGLLAILGVAARDGRTFTDADTLDGQNHVVLIGERFWRTHYGGDPAIVGRTLTLNGTPHEVLGVMPEKFHFPSLQQQLWLPLDASVQAAPGEGPLTSIARLRTGLSLPLAQRRIDTLVAQLDRDHPLPSGWGLRISADTVTHPDDQTRRAVLILFGAVGLVLLTACANVANVLLSRAVDRRREFAIRLALGASRGRLARELIVEGLLLGMISAAAGLTAARWALATLVTLAPEQLTFVTTTAIAVDGRVVAFGVALAMVTGILCNLPPAIRALRSGSAEGLSGRGRTDAATPLHRRWRATLVVVEVSLSVILLVGAALMARSFVRLRAIDIGFDPSNVLAVSVGLDSTRYETEAARLAFLDAVARGVAQLPGVQGVAVASGVPPTPGELSYATLESDAGPCGSERAVVVSNLISPDYFSVLRIALAEGRPLTASDPPEAIVVSQALARRCSGGRLAGRRLRLGPGAPWLTVVGVADDVRTLGLTNGDGALAVYIALSAGDGALPNMATRLGDTRFVARRLVVRGPRPLSQLAGIKRVLWAQDPDQPVLDASLAEDLMADTIRSERFVLTLMSLFSAVSIALAGAGIFGVLAYAVAQRTREIGIRMALGATSGDVVRLVVGHGMALAAVGVVAGMAGAFTFSRVLAGLLYEIEPRDPAVFIVMPVAVLGVALLACWIPAARAFRVDPASALRND